MSTTTAHPLDSDRDIVGEILAFESGDLTALETLELFGHLIRTGLAWSLQGSYGRTAANLIDNGLIDPETGNVTDAGIDWTASFPEE